MIRWLQSVINFFASSIRKKIIIPYAVLTLILAALGAFIITRVVATSFEDRLKNQLLEAGRVVSDEIVKREEFRLEIERAVASTIGVAEALIERDVDTLEDLIFPLIANTRAVDTVVILDTQAREVIRIQRDRDGFMTTTPKGGLDYSGSPLIRQILADPESNKEAQLARDPATNALIIYTIGPITTDNGVVGAALVGTYLEKELERLQNLALAQLVLFNEAGEVIVTTFNLDEAEREEIFQVFTPERYQQVLKRQQVTLLDQVQLSESQGENSNDVVISNRTYRLAYAPFILRGRIYGVYAVALATNFITDTTGQSQLALTIIFTGGALAVFAVGYGIARFISGPILRLVRTAQAIAAGDLEQRTGLARNDEIGILATTFDTMTIELQRLLQLQKEEASKLNAILNSIADGVIVQDTKGDILIKNPAAEEILEKMEENYTALPQTVSDPPVTPLFQAETDAALLLQRLTSLEFRATDRIEMGHQVFSALSAPVITPDNEQLGSVVVLRDITREVESEKLKDEFITSISHELKTPLTAIKGYNNLLRMMREMELPEDETTDRQISIIKTMDEELNDLDNLIQALLDLSQINAGELGLDQEPVDLLKLIKEETRNWIDKMKERNLVLSTRLPDEPVWVEGDYDRLSRVVHHLIKNAHAYTLPGGKVEVCLTRQNGQAQVHVKDTGVGIAPQDQRFIYTRFFRAIHDERTYEVGGAGLGLYTSKAIIEAHHGTIWMKSELHQGSTFSFSLPVIEPETDKPTRQK